MAAAHGGLPERALREARASLPEWMRPEDLCVAACIGHVGRELAAGADWAGLCVQQFGAVCTQYLRYLGLDKGPGAGERWHELCLRLRRFHHQLRRERLDLAGCCRAAPALDLWPRSPRSDREPRSEDRATRLLQGGHTVFFYGSEEEVRVLPATRTSSSREEREQDAPASAAAAAASEEALALAPFLDVAPVSPWELIGVTRELVLERWRLGLGHGARRVRQRSTGLQRRDAGEFLRLFLEHVAVRLFLFHGSSVLAFELDTLEPLYMLDVCGGEPAAAKDVEILARWDYGRAFLVYHVDGGEASIWSSSDGRSRGRVRAALGLLCCDVTHGELSSADSPEEARGLAVGRASTIVATLEVDGRIRLYRDGGGDSEWLQLGTVDGELAIYVEVKLEGLLLMAVSHSDDGEAGAVHVWDVRPAGAGSHRSRGFASAPDRVEARHGGAFVEVCLPKEPCGRRPHGVFDVRWLDPRDAGLRVLLALDSAVGDWRCDIRDCVALVEEDTMLVRQFAAWPPLKFA